MNYGASLDLENKILWEIEPHTLAKHEILKNYLQAWFLILGRTYCFRFGVVSSKAKLS